MIRVLIAEDMRLLRDALVLLLRMESDFEVVAELASGVEVLPMAEATRPDVAVLDIGLPGVDGISVARALRGAVPQCRTMILTGLTGPGYLRRAVAANVAGFMLKTSAPDRFSGAIREIAAGRRVIDPDAALAVLDDGSRTLTPRELQVLRHIADGHQVADVASRLGLSSGTVRNHLNSVVSKLNARNRIDAIRIARDGGWL